MDGPAAGKPRCHAPTWPAAPDPLRIAPAPRQRLLTSGSPARNSSLNPRDEPIAPPLLPVNLSCHRNRFNHLAHPRLRQLFYCPTVVPSSSGPVGPCSSPWLRSVVKPSPHSIGHAKGSPIAREDGAVVRLATEVLRANFGGFRKSGIDLASNRSKNIIPGPVDVGPAVVDTIESSAGVAQLVEHNVANVVVVGSNPITRSWVNGFPSRATGCF